MKTEPHSLPKVFVCPVIYGLSRADQIAQTEGARYPNVRFGVGLDRLNDARPEAEYHITNPIREALRTKYKGAEVGQMATQDVTAGMRETGEDLAHAAESKFPPVAAEMVEMAPLAHAAESKFPPVAAEVVEVAPEVAAEFGAEEEGS